MITRRQFLASTSAGSLVLGGYWSSETCRALEHSNNVLDETFQPDFFVAVESNGTVKLLAHRSEMGTGIRTALPRIIADELEADWEKVEIVQAPGDERLGDQNTDGSNSIRFFFDRMRFAGATARTMLERAAAQHWDISPEECFADNHQVRNRLNDRSLGFGDLVQIARTLDIPAEEELKLKSRDRWRYIGKDAKITDLDEIVTGKAVYGIDARMENQLYAVIARPPVVGATVRSFDSTRARSFRGVEEVIEIPKYSGAPRFQPLGGVAVCATDTWAAWCGRDALDIEWDEGPNQDYDTDAFALELAETVKQPGRVLREAGDTLDALAQSSNIVEADYSVPHLAHAPMEPACAVAQVAFNDSGEVISCHVIAATQNPQAVQEAVGRALELREEDVLVDVTLLGAGFGRKSKPDYCVEAAILSRELRRPVHVTWTREDDLSHDYYHAISAIHCEAAIGSNGLPSAWLQRVAYPTIGSTFNTRSSTPASWEAEMGHTDIPFDVPNIRCEVGTAQAHVRIGWLRSVCHIQQNFAVSSFVDELAVHAQRDPVEYLLDLLGEDRHLDLRAARLSNRNASPRDYPYDLGRLKNVLRRVAELAEWSRIDRLQPGRGLGVACCRSFLGYTAHIVEVDVTPNGRLSVPQVWVSLDAGTIVSPDRVRSQLEGAAIMALSQARFGKISFKRGRAIETNFDSYPVALMSDAPKTISMDIVESDAPPAGVGETGVPSFAPALCNAIYNATGKRIRNLPLSEHDLSWS